MKLLGFNFTKINIEKEKDSFKDLKISNNIDIASITEVKQDVFKSNDEVLAIKFKYNVSYEPKIAKIDLEGSILLSLDDTKLAKEVLKKWKDKETPEEFKIPLFNIIFRKAGLKALELEEEMNLPIHIQMPMLRKQENQEKK